MLSTKTVRGLQERMPDLIIVPAHDMRAFAQMPKLQVALRKYEGLRRPRTTEVVRNSWQTGRIIQMDSPALESVRNWFMGTRIGGRLEMRTFRSLLTYKLPSLRAAVPEGWASAIN